jgi:hypothetical protein
VSVTPLERVSDRRLMGSVDERFKDARNELDVLSILFCATKAAS